MILEYLFSFAFSGIYLDRGYSQEEWKNLSGSSKALLD
jgi:hypothetical protein